MPITALARALPLPPPSLIFLSLTLSRDFPVSEDKKAGAERRVMKAAGAFVGGVLALPISPNRWNGEGR